MKKVKVNTFNGKIYGVSTLNGKTYVFPGWIEVPLGTSLEQVELDSNLPIVKPVEPKKVVQVKPERLTFEAKSSKGDKTYQITRIDGEWDCSCPAKMFFSGNCKHIKKIIETETLA